MLTWSRSQALLSLVILISAYCLAQNPASPTSAPFKIGTGVSAPKVIYHPDPEYSEKARAAKFQGTCVLWLVVGTDGRPSNIRVARTLGMGLDEKAIEAVRQWKFEPARKDGLPVAVQINVEVSFRLYPELVTNPEIMELSRKALTGDLEATTKLGLAYLNADGTDADSARGMKLLEYAARHGSTHAQFELAQQIAKSAPEQGVPDYVSAYSWYGIAKRGGHKVKDKIFRDLEAKMTPDQLTAAKTRIDAWPQPSAK